MRSGSPPSAPPACPESWLVSLLLRLALHQFQRAILHRGHQFLQPRLQAVELDIPVLVSLPEGDELPRPAAGLSRHIDAEMAPGAVVQERHPAATPPSWVLEVMPNHAVQQFFGL